MKSKEKLLLLQEEGTYVFHGSPDIIKTLIPRQAYNKNEKTEEMEIDGKSAVCATPYADIAIFRALINSKDFTEESTSSFGIENMQLYFSATKNLLDRAKNKIGYVYILDKQTFKKFNGIECRSSKSNNPIEIIEVCFDDLPQNIEIV